MAFLRKIEDLSFRGKVMIFILILFPSAIFAQKHDTVTFFQREFITDQLENIARSTDLKVDYSDLLDQLTYYQKHPISINDKNEVDMLEKLTLLNDIQVNNIKRYRERYGDILTQYELQFVEGFNRSVIQRILPFVRFGKPKTKEKLSLKQAFKYGHHQLFLRYTQQIEKSNGYKLPPDSALNFPGSNYLGPSFRIYTRYAFRYRKKIKIGFTMEKDPGEVFLKSSLTDTVLDIVGDKAKNIFDFYSAHIFLADMGILKKAIVGDYHLEFGQGLNLWSGLGFGKSAQAIYVKKFGNGIRPNTSVNENRYFRGAAATISLRPFELTGFYSNIDMDANLLDFDTLDQPYVTTIQETGLHRTINELLAKNAINIKAYGGHLKYRYKIFEIGATAYHTKLSHPLKPGKTLYRKFAFSGDKETHYGADFNLIFNKVNFFGEFSLTGNNAFAVIAGMNAGFTDRFLFTLAYRNYSRNFHNFYGLPFGAVQKGSNEEGIYLGFVAYLTKILSLSGYVDHFRFPWLRYYSDFPSYGNDYLFQLNITPYRKVSAYIKYRHKRMQENHSDDYDYTAKIDNINQDNVRFNITWSLSRSVIMKNRFEYVLYKPEYGEKSNGYLIYQDVLFRPPNLPLSLTLRYALFSTGSWDSRIYAYENDILYAFSVPAYYGTGQRVYCVAGYKFNRYFTFWFRIARATWFDRNIVGSGADMVDTNHKTELKVQMRMKF